MFSSALAPERLAEAPRGHSGSANSLHEVLDDIIKEDQTRRRRGHGARNMAVIRSFASSLGRIGRANLSARTKRKLAGRYPAELQAILSPHSR